jgi:hypothetical protein
MMLKHSSKSANGPAEEAEKLQSEEPSPLRRVLSFYALRVLTPQAQQLREQEQEK